MCTVPGGTASTQVLTGSMNGLITVWDTAYQWSRAALCKGHENDVWALCYVRDSETVASGSADNTVRIWEPRSWRCLRILRDHSGWVVGLSSGPGWLLSCSLDTSVRAWDVQGWQCHRAFSDGQPFYCVCAFGGGRFATGGAESSIIVYGGSDGDATPPHRRAKAAARPGGGGARGHGASPPQHGTQMDQVDLDMSFGHFQQAMGTELQNRWNRNQQRQQGPDGGQDRLHSLEEVSHSRPRSQTPTRNSGQRTPPQGPPQHQQGGYPQAVPPPSLQRGTTPPRSPRHSHAPVPQQQPSPRHSHAPAPQQRPPPLHGAPAGADLDFETQRAVPRFDVPPAGGPPYFAGGQAQIFSVSQNCWLNADVTKVEEGRVTLEYRFPNGGKGTKQLPVGHEFLRPMGPSTPISANTADFGSQRR